MELSDFWAAVAEAKTPPCEELNCANQKRCGTAKLACAEFWHYANLGGRDCGVGTQIFGMPYDRMTAEERLTPTRRCYNKVFHEID